MLKYPIDFLTFDQCLLKRAHVVVRDVRDVIACFVGFGGEGCIWGVLGYMGCALFIKD